jgi:hypothetical protein
MLTHATPGAEDVVELVVVDEDVVELMVVDDVVVVVVVEELVEALQVPKPA